jgi:AAA domain
MQEYFSSTDSNFNTTKRRNVIIADLIAQALANAGPELGKPAMTVTSNLVPDALANAAPELGAPSIVAEEVEEVNAPLQPNPFDISNHLYALFAPGYANQFPAALIEIAYGKPDGGLNRCEHFPVFDLEAATNFAVARNNEGNNVYVVPALLSGTTPPGRAKDVNTIASRYSWAEYDGAGDAERIDALLTQHKFEPEEIITTGTVPHLRKHLYFRIKDGITDMDKLRAANIALRDLLGSDDVQNPARLMRLAGTVSYPSEKKRAKGYISEVTKLRTNLSARSVTAEQLIGLKPCGPSTDGRLDLNKAGRQRDRSGYEPRTFFQRVNDAAMDAISTWVPTIFPMAVYQKGTGAYRISSKALGRDLEEDLSIAPTGIVDFGVHDMGDPREGRRTPIDLLIEFCGYEEPGAAAFKLCELLDREPEYFGWDSRSTPKQPQPQADINSALKFLTLDQWRQRDLPPPDFLMAEVFSTTSRTLLAAATGLGKTNVALAIGMRMAAGARFLHWQGYRKSKVLYIDGEMSRRLLKQRLDDEERRLFKEVSPRLNTFKPDGFHALSTADIDSFPPLNTPAGQALIERIITDIGGIDFVIFDNVMCLIAGPMVDEEAWRQTMPWVLFLTRRNIGQLWIHHTNDENKLFGTKTRAWQMDSVIVLTTVERTDQVDISFELAFMKARERTPENRDDFQKIAIFLKDNEWRCDKPTKKKGKVTPQAEKYYQALVNVVGGSDLPKSKKLHGRHAVHNDDWWAECVQLGLIDPKEKPNSARALFSKNRRELVAADRIACQGEYSWLL